MRWFKRDLRIGTGKALALVASAFVGALVAACVLGLVIGLMLKSWSE